MASSKTIYFYGRAGFPVKESLRAFAVPEELLPKVELIKATLAELDNKPYISSAYFRRVVWYLKEELGLTELLANDLIARQFGYANYNGLKRSRSPDEAYHKQRAKSPGIRAQLMGDMRSSAAKLRDGRKDEKAAREAARVLQNGTMGSSTSSAKYKAYFFHNQPSHVLAIEEKLSGYNDCYLQHAVDHYPRRMENDLYYKSFGLFWREILKMQETGQADFSQPGLRMTKRLCHHLFTWNFRRYLADTVIARYAPFLPVEYRHQHIAAKLDSSPLVDVDLPYVEMDYADEVDDNFGNC